MPNDSYLKITTGLVVVCKSVKNADKRVTVENLEALMIVARETAAGRTITKTELINAMGLSKTTGHRTINLMRGISTQSDLLKFESPYFEPPDEDAPKGYDNILLSHRGKALCQLIVTIMSH